MILHYTYHLSSRTLLLFASLFLISLSSQMALGVKNPPAIAGDLRDVDSIPGLGRSPGEGRATHSSILAWRIPETEEPDELQSMGLQSWTRPKQLSTHSSC